MFCTPRFSYSVPKTAVSALPTLTAMATAGGYGYGVWGTGGWGRGSTHRPSTLLEEQTRQRSGPRNLPAGRWSGWSGAADVQAPTPPLPAVGPAPLGGTLPRANAASGPIKARFNLILLKYSQNRVVSPKYVHKACHSPYIQNGSQKSPLRILRFPYSLAFSHKELLGPF